MKKNIKYLSILLAAFFFSISSCFAVEMTLDELGEKIGEKSTSYYAYIIGKYVFPGDHVLTMQDVMLASRTIEITDQEGWSNEDDIYNEMSVNYIKAKYNDDDEIIGWETKNNLVGTKQLDSTKIDVDYIVTRSGNFKITKEAPAPQAHSVKFMVGETEKDNVEVNDGEKVANPGELEVKDNYKFMGWYEDDEFNTEFDFNTEITKDYVLYAKYLPMVDINTILTNRMNSEEVTNIAEYTSSLENKTLTYNVVDNDATFDKVSMNGALELINNDNIEKIVITGEGLDDTYEITKGAGEVENATTLNNIYLTMVTVFQDYADEVASDFTINDIIGMNLNVKFVMANGSVSENGNTEETYTLTVTGNKILKHTVSFIHGNDTYNERIVDGETVSAMDLYGKIDANKIVEGWYTETELTNKYDFDTPVTSDLELYPNIVDKCTVVINYVTDGASSGTDERQIACGTKFTYGSGNLYTDIALSSEFDNTTTINSNTDLYTPSTREYMNNLIKTEIIDKVNSDKYSVSRSEGNINFALIDGEQLVANTTGTGLVGGLRRIIRNENVTSITIAANDKTYELDNDEIDPDTHVSYVQTKLIEIITDLTGKPFTQVKQSDLIGKSFNLTINNDEFVALDDEDGTVYTVNFAGNGE